MNRDELLQTFDLTGRVAIVTGGSRGIGRAVAEGFAAVGARVVVASRKADACEEAAAAVRAAGGTAVAVATHMGDLDAVRSLVARTVDEFGGVDVVVNNAANPLAMPIGSITPEALAKSHDVNLRGPLFLVQEALPHLRASDHAAIVNVLTAGIFTRGEYVSLYVSAKSALQAMTRAMAAELAGDGIRANGLAPGTVRTDMVLNTDEAFQQLAVDSQVIKRMAEPEEMVPAALFLASDASSFMTGQTLVVDGGMTTH
ncbi:SDR family NAD(P)-dependent oxidoreductase [Dermatobacter hominis]|uniref:SDR family NAD(P)-dependent oxidoreductase n=1 Tax=Dermatobacter hominis TaxID=2884263 RepID=UPI001D121CFB|nr:glucose 1-dehydrogenase [Dermatobacter hominis]UDY34435.1 glucose 1-dehydrogenase [Dermatobacter hominis]